MGGVQHPDNSTKHLDTVDSNASDALPTVTTDSSTSTSNLGKQQSQGESQTDTGSGSGTRHKGKTLVTRHVKARRRHLGMLQTMLEASRRAAEFVTSFRSALRSVTHISPGCVMYRCNVPA